MPLFNIQKKVIHKTTKKIYYVVDLYLDPVIGYQSEPLL